MSVSGNLFCTTRISEMRSTNDKPSIGSEDFIPLSGSSSDNVSYSRQKQSRKRDEVDESLQFTPRSIYGDNKLYSRLCEVIKLEKIT